LLRTTSQNGQPLSVVMTTSGCPWAAAARAAAGSESVVGSAAVGGSALAARSGVDVAVGVVAMVCSVD